MLTKQLFVIIIIIIYFS